VLARCRGGPALLSRLGAEWMRFKAVPVVTVVWMDLRESGAEQSNREGRRSSPNKHEGSTLKHFHITSRPSRQGVKANHRALDVTRGAFKPPLWHSRPRPAACRWCKLSRLLGSLGSLGCFDRGEGKLTARTAGRAVGRPSQAAHHFQRSSSSLKR